MNGPESTALDPLLRPTGGPVEDLLRDLTPQVVAILARRTGDFDAAEDAVQEALLEAVRSWPERGAPDSPRAWLVTVAMRRLVDARRSTTSRVRRERLVALREVPAEPRDVDDSLLVLLMCCHPALTPASATALTLRAVGGLTTAEIARAFLVPESTMAQRISRAKATLRGERLDAGSGLEPRDLDGRLVPALRVLYLLFNEGYVASAGSALQRIDLCDEAIRLARSARAARPDHAELTGLLALLLLLDARRPARLDERGALVPLAEQDRSRWAAEPIAEALGLLDAAIGTGRPGAYQVQAAIAALHARARSAEETDWPQISALYALLERLTANPVVTLNRVVAVSYADGPTAARALLDTVAGELCDHPRLPAVRAHLMELAGDHGGAAAAYALAADRAGTLPERRHLTAKAAALRDAAGPGSRR